MKGCSPYALARLLVERAEAELATARAGVPDRVTVLPSKPPFEFCGQLWAAVTAISPPSGSGAHRTSVKACGTFWRVGITLGVYRCDPTINEQHPEQPASPEVYDSGTRDVLDDAEALRRAVFGADWQVVDVDPSGVVPGAARIVQSGGGLGAELDVVVDTELGRFTDEAVPMLPGDPRTPSGEATP